MGNYKKEKTCEVCGVTFLGGNRAKYCALCRLDKDREYSAQTRERIRAGTARKFGSTGICLRCKETYIVQGARQKYCSQCAHQVILENHRRRNRELYYGNPEIRAKLLAKSRAWAKNNPEKMREIVARYDAKMRKVGTPRKCRYCGQEFLLAKTNQRYCSNTCCLKNRQKRSQISKTGLQS